MSSICLAIGASLPQKDDGNPEWRDRKVLPPITEAVKRRNRARAAQAREKKVEELQRQKRADLLAFRLDQQAIPPASRYAILGEIQM